MQSQYDCSILASKPGKAIKKKKNQCELKSIIGKDFDKMEMDSFQVIKNHYLIFKVHVLFKKKIGLFFKNLVSNCMGFCPAFPKINYLGLNSITLDIEK